MTIAATDQHFASRRWLPFAPAMLPWGLLVPAALLVAWQTLSATGVMPEQILPAPSRVLRTLVELAQSGDLGAAVQISAWRLSVGLVLGVTLGFLFGALLGASHTAEDWFGPSFRAVAAVPSLGWIPILILLVGIDEMLKVIILTKACFVPMTIATKEAWRAVPRRYDELGLTLGLSRRSRFLRITLPSMVPILFGGLRQAAGTGFLALVTCEMLAATEGIGYLMVWGRTLFQMDLVIAGVLVVGASGIALDKALRWFERRIRLRMGGTDG